MSVEEDLGREIIRRIEELDEPSEEEVRKIVDGLTADHEPQPQPPFDGHIESIRVQGIRSFGEEQELELSRGLTIVYAENGTGKTSFVDAVELLTAGVTTRAKQVPDLKNEVKDEDHIPHSTVDGKQLCDPRVSVSWVDGGRSLEASWAGEWGVGAVNVPSIQLLARRRLREIINSKGVDRAVIIGDAVGLASTDEKWANAQKFVSNAAGQLTSSGISPVASSVKEAAAEFLEKNGSQAGREVDEIAKMIELEALAKVDALRRGLGDQALPDVWNRRFDPPPSVPDVTDLNDLAKRLGEHDANAPGVVVDDGLLQLLESFLAVAEEGETCPACAVGTVTTTRIGEVQRQLAATASERERLRRHERLRNDLRDELNRISGRDLAWHLPVWDEQALHLFTGGAGFDTAYRELRQSAGAWAEHRTRLRASIELAKEQLSQEFLHDVTRVLSELIVVRPAAQERANELEAQRSEAVHALRGDELRAAEQAVRDARRVAEVIVEDGKVQACAAALNVAAGHLKTRRAEVLEAKLVDLAEPINSWIRKLAPERTPPIRLKVTQGSGAPRLNVLIEGGNVKAIGRLSDSQLDMLGLASHLATIEREHVGAPLILDDPTDMLDIGTVEKLAKEGINSLMEPDSGYGRQVVVLTHDDQLIKLLWENHGQRFPCTVQWFIELDQSGGLASQSRFKPRSAHEYADRLRRLLGKNAESSNLFWLRSAAGNLARQTLEAVVSDLFEVMGPNGLRYMTSLARVEESRKKGSLFKCSDLLEEQFEKVREMHGDCGESRHENAGKFMEEVEKAISTRGQYLLNEASHANHVYPRVAKIREYQKLLSGIAGRFGHADDDKKTRARSAVPDDWPRTSQWSSALRPCEQNCHPDSFFPHYRP
ncbi:hypothetical protein GCM10027271_50120 [Saccharopolyspora gloriosae]